MELKITENDIESFKEWIELDFETMSWEGRYLDDFNLFWKLLFKKDTEYADQFEKLKLLTKRLNSGPLISWFKWIREHFICYLFVFKELNLEELKNISSSSYSEVSLILRDFLLERHPHLEDIINELLQINSITSPNIRINYKKICEELNLIETDKGTLGEEVLSNLEITLYPDWRETFNYLNSEQKVSQISVEDFTKKATFKKQIKFLRELTVLFIIGGIIIAGIKFGNKYYEEYLEKKISLYVPSFFELQKNLSFKSTNPLNKENVELSFKELDKLEKLESKQVFEDAKVQQRFDGESDVVLTSVESLPKDFEVANLEQSNYEETKKGGYRNSRFGRLKAYRIMMTSIDPKKTKKEIIDILNFFEVQKADNVEPGTQIPGGIYFNLYVARKQLSEFLSRVTTLEEATILESKTNRYPPRGTNKVFIWIKSI